MVEERALEFKEFREVFISGLVERARSLGGPSYPLINHLRNPTSGLNTNVIQAAYDSAEQLGLPLTENLARHYAGLCLGAICDAYEFGRDDLMADIKRAHRSFNPHKIFATFDHKDLFTPALRKDE